MNPSRKLKIHRKYRSRQGKYTTVPEIRLEGRWLEALGFHEGEEVHIKQAPGKLTITLVEEEKV